MAPSFQFFLDVPFRSEWENIDLLRTSVLNCLSAMLGNVEGCHAVAMVTGELLENAVKYGDWSSPARFRLRVSGGDAGVTVSVENPIKPDDKGIRELADMLEWIQ